MHNTHEYSGVCDCIALYASVAVSKTPGFRIQPHACVWLDGKDTRVWLYTLGLKKGDRFIGLKTILILYQFRIAAANLLHST